MLEWHTKPSGAAQTVIADVYRCEVWGDRLGRWTAFVTDGRAVYAHFPLPNAEAAKVWCEARVPGAQEMMVGAGA